MIFTGSPYKQGVGEIAAFLFRLADSISSGTFLRFAHDTIPPGILEFLLRALPIFALRLSVIHSEVLQRREISRDLIYRKRNCTWCYFKCGFSLRFRFLDYSAFSALNRSVADSIMDGSSFLPCPANVSDLPTMDTESPLVYGVASSLPGA